MQYILHMFIYIYSCSERETGREGQTRLSVCNKFLAHPQHAQLISSHRIASRRDRDRDHYYFNLEFSHFVSPC